MWRLGDEEYGGGNDLKEEWTYLSLLESLRQGIVVVD